MAQAAVERIVVQATAKEKNEIAKKAEGLGLPVAELMRRGAFAYQADKDETELMVLADAAKTAADRSAKSIDDALDFIESSNRRIAAMENKAAKATARKAA
jgi:hypothetical protein